MSFRGDVIGSMSSLFSLTHDEQVRDGWMSAKHSVTRQPASHSHAKSTAPLSLISEKHFTWRSDMTYTKIIEVVLRLLLEQIEALLIL